MTPDVYHFGYLVIQGDMTSGKHVRFSFHFSLFLESVRRQAGLEGMQLETTTMTYSLLGLVEKIYGNIERNSS
jgi:hypothetical protein